MLSFININVPVCCISSYTVWCVIVRWGSYFLRNVDSDTFCVYWFYLFCIIFRQMIILILNTFIKDSSQKVLTERGENNLWTKRWDSTVNILKLWQYFYTQQCHIVHCSEEENYLYYENEWWMHEWETQELKTDFSVLFQWLLRGFGLILAKCSHIYFMFYKIIKCWQ